MLDNEILQRFIELEKRKDELDGDLSSVKAELALLKASLLDQMLSAGLDSVKSNGRTVFMSTRIFAKKLGSEHEVKEALRLSGNEYLIKESVNTNSLNGLVKEYMQSGEGLPPEFEGIIAANEVTEVKSKAT